MDFSGLSSNELAGATRALFDTLHLRQAALPESAFKTGVQRRLDIAHKAMQVLQEHLVNGGIISPDSGGDPK